MNEQDDKDNQTAAAAFADFAERQDRSPQPNRLPPTDVPDAITDHRPASVIPPRFRLLFVSEQRPEWVGFALRLDAIGCSEPRLEWASTAEEALKLLSHNSYDCLLIQADPASATARRELLQAIRVSGCDEPIVLVSATSNDMLALAACEFHAELLVSTAGWDAPALLSYVQRSLRIQQLQEDHHRLQVENHRRLVRERDEAERLLKQQRSMVEELQTLVYPGELDFSSDESAQENTVLEESVQEGEIPADIPEYYHELLRTYVIMGSGSLKDEIIQIAELLAAARLTSRQVLEFHLQCVETIVRGLGNRSSRHVMSRADLLALEMMVHLGECYQKKLPE
ncbi:hypothetical protein Pan153_36380 [Gimesia panareensis]|uniref:Response regulatory domain-containing protein n=1 Tax=Gimesia panareensis TaxID=2527978 RepID=A0A518FRL5_9PLAN|nr:hypothetical protein [Gimesia panareensis]QDV18977.1 hypothetical protein Pan153_36380 [Gimesia panareensis]